MLISGVANDLPVKLLSFAFLLFAGMSSPVLAQTDDSGTAETDEGPTSLTVGTLTTTFTFPGDYDYETNARALMVSGPGGSLLLDYGSFEAPNEVDRETRRTIGVEALFGGNAYLFRELLFLPLDVYVPIRLNLDYRYVQPKRANESNLHRGAAGLGAGGGAQLRFPIGPEFVKENLVVRGTAVLVPAVATSLNRVGETEETSPDETAVPIRSGQTRMRRMINVDLEVVLTEILGQNAGVAVGYTFRSYSRSGETPSSVGDVIDAATFSGDYTRTSVQHMVRIGLSW